MAKRSPQVSPHFVMSEAEWKELWKRLKLFTYKHYGPLLGHIRALDLDEVILEAIEDTLSGVRRWPPINEEIPLFYFLCQTIRSKIYNLIKQSRRHVSIQDEINAEQSPLHSMRAKEESDERARYNQLGEKLLESVCSDPLSKRIVRLYIKDPSIKPREIAHELGISIREIQNAQKRLNRRAKRIHLLYEE